MVKQEREKRDDQLHNLVHVFLYNVFVYLTTLTQKEIWGVSAEKKQFQKV